MNLHAPFPSAFTRNHTSVTYFGVAPLSTLSSPVSARTVTSSAVPLSASLQGTYFHTDDYDSRVYASERGLLYTFYTPSFSGRGFRWSAYLRYDFRNWLMLIAKFGQTVYQDRDEISSGNDLIRSNRKTDLQMQLRLKF